MSQELLHVSTAYNIQVVVGITCTYIFMQHKVHEIQKSYTCQNQLLHLSFNLINMSPY